jgi:hypothetical protein
VDDEPQAEGARVQMAKATRAQGFTASQSLWLRWPIPVSSEKWVVNRYALQQDIARSPADCQSNRMSSVVASVLSIPVVDECIDRSTRYGTCGSRKLDLRALGYSTTGFPIQHTRLAPLLRGAAFSRDPDFAGGNVCRSNRFCSGIQSGRGPSMTPP